MQTVAKLSVGHSPDGVTVTPPSLYIYMLTLEAILQHLLPGADIHLPVSTLLHLAPVASDQPSGDVFEKTTKAVI